MRRCNKRCACNVLKVYIENVLPYAERTSNYANAEVQWEQRAKMCKVYNRVNGEAWHHEPWKRGTIDHQAGLAVQHWCDWACSDLSFLYALPHVSLEQRESRVRVQRCHVISELRERAHLCHFDLSEVSSVCHVTSHHLSTCLHSNRSCCYGNDTCSFFTDSHRSRDLSIRRLLVIQSNHFAGFELHQSQTSVPVMR